jgi:frataxin-like iron-binding protein CyaY
MNKRNPYQRLWINKITSGMGVFIFNHNLWYGSPYIHPQPQE